MCNLANPMRSLRSCKPWVVSQLTARVSVATIVVVGPHKTFAAQWRGSAAKEEENQMLAGYFLASALLQKMKGEETDIASAV
jgi:hypothetical protein